MSLVEQGQTAVIVFTEYYDGGSLSGAYEYGGNCLLADTDFSEYYMIYDMIYLIAIGLTPGGSSAVYIYTQTVHRTTQSTQTIHRTTQLTQTIHRTTQLTQTIHRTTQLTQTIHRTTQLTRTIHRTTQFTN
jgi:hypothetical protein